MEEWPEDWIAKAKRVAKAFLKSHYVKAATSSATPSAPSGAKAALTSLPALEPHTKGLIRDRLARSTQAANPVSTATLFDEFIAFPPTFEQVLDLETSLNEPVDHDPLRYWLKVRATASPALKPIADLAVDIFIAPASTVDVERLFFRGRRTVGDYQHALAPSTISALMTLSSDYKLGLLPPGTLARHRLEHDANARRRCGKTRSLKTFFSSSSSLSDVGGAPASLSASLAANTAVPPFLRAPRKSELSASAASSRSKLKKRVDAIFVTDTEQDLESETPTTHRSQGQGRADRHEREGTPLAFGVDYFEGINSPSDKL
ncbi:hypothetical protein Rhopal_000015-T1 [Rhodotorula paludigena]|uniref:HAT C-terminal dimerisation domain-containing protein n=1 Tax=Rhodotorula paludigena TaxID=86838 RepID=A0AAV5GBP4_9BASI|nr:hypothetical protein Rhopal_000015-T1 [Rhodotorula paludigena]